MASLYSLAQAILVIGLVAPALTEEISPASDSEVSARHFFKKKKCRFGGCGGENFNGINQGGYGGYPAQYPPINIGISQSQSSASAGGGGYGSGYYPNNYQYNGNPYSGYLQRPGGFNRPGYYGNGQGSYNNQFNGNYYSPGGYSGYPGGGWNGYQRPYGSFYDSGEGEDIYSDAEDRDRDIYNEYVQGFSNVFDDALDVFSRSGSAASARSLDKKSSNVKTKS